MKKIFFSLMALVFSLYSYGQIVGTWKTIDDNSGEAKSYVKIFKKSNGQYYGKVVKLLITPEDPNCSLCSDDRKGKPILGMEVIRGLEKDGDEYNDGTITDPKNGKTYKCIIENDGADKIKVRGYIGIPLIGRTQTWYRVK